MATGMRVATDPAAESAGKIPPLRNGDRLTADEFMRRYEAMPHLKKAELIEGVVYMPSPDSYAPCWDPRTMSSPASFDSHANPHFELIGWLYHYAGHTPGIRGGDNGTLLLDLDNRPQPDAFLIIVPEAGGRVTLSEDGYVVGAPELVAEVAYSSVSFDLHQKLNVYRRNNVQEYVVWRTEDRQVDWFALREGRYEPLAAAEDGSYRSLVLPGLRLDAEGLLRHDVPAVLAAVQRGLASPEHAAFVERLRQEAARLAEGQGGPRR